MAHTYTYKVPTYLDTYAGSSAFGADGRLLHEGGGRGAAARPLPLGFIHELVSYTPFVPAASPLPRIPSAIAASLYGHYTAAARCVNPWLARGAEPHPNPSPLGPRSHSARLHQLEPCTA